MLKKFIIFAIFFLLLTTQSKSKGMYYYVLNDECIITLYELATRSLLNRKIEILKDPYGIIIRIPLNNKINIDQDIYEKILHVKYFLAKIKNPVIIEVHVGRDFENEFKNYKNWELTTVLANQIEAIITDTQENLKYDRFKSIGYGEFFPNTNTPNNGSNSQNRIDIIVLCNVTGE